MNYPKLNEIPTTRDMIDKFKGYNHNLRIGEGEFYNTENLTGDHYPVMSPRKQRGVYKSTKNANGLCSNTELCYAEGREFYVGDKFVDLLLTNDDQDGIKDLISFGSYVIVMPDQKYVNTVDLEDRGSLKNGVYYLPTSVEGKKATIVVEPVDMCGGTLLNGSNHIWVSELEPLPAKEAYRKDDGYWEGLYESGNLGVPHYSYGGDYWFKVIKNAAGEVLRWDLYQVFKKSDGSFEWGDATISHWDDYSDLGR
jgi:hypothetical protein